MKAKIWLDPVYRRLPSGWRFGASLAMFFTSLILIVNIALLSATFARGNRNGFIITTHEGSCNRIGRIGTISHVVINVISTFLLGCSSSVMQRLCAPTRGDIDKAHQKGRWLDVGTLSLRNLAAVEKTRAILWVLLSLSSLPLHLVYNSIVFVSTTNHLYDVYVVSEKFQQGSWFDPGVFNNANFTDNWALWPNFVEPSIIQTTLLQHASASDAASFEVLSPAQCIKAYSKQVLSDRRNLVLVTSTLPRENKELSKPLDPDIIRDPSFPSLTGFQPWNCSTEAGNYNSSVSFNSITCLSNSSLYAILGYDMPPLPTEMKPISTNWFDWVCSQYRLYYDYIPYGGDRIEVPDFLKPPPKGSLCSDGFWKQVSEQESWSVYGFEIEYCLSERPSTQCSLQVAGHLWLVVIVFIAIKSICICTTIVLYHRHKPLLTIGDAIASFITTNDSGTKGACLLSRRDTNNLTVDHPQKQCSFFIWRRYRDIGQPGSKIFHPTPRRWWQSVSRTRWGIMSFLCFAAVSTSLGLLGYAISSLKSFGRNDIQSIWEIGLGRINPWIYITIWKLPQTGQNAIVWMAMMANLPQLLMSLLYMAVNGVMTSMCLADEWSQHSYNWRTLRVSSPSPSGQQRSSYFLQLPYRFAIPLLVFSAFMHWIISQAMFLIKLETRTATGLLAQANMPGEFEDMLGYTITTCGFSPLAIIIAVIGITMLFLLVVAFGMRKLKQNGMPLAGSCSIAIAASCHCPPGTSSDLPLMWGVVTSANSGETTGNKDNKAVEGTDHCSFANDNVSVPVPGKVYA